MTWRRPDKLAQPVTEKGHDPGGAVVLTGSPAGSKGLPALSIYSATKAAIRSLARTWTTDLKGRGIRVNVVSPGVVLTPAMQAYLRANAGAEEALRQMIPLARIGQADEVAAAVLFLSAPESRFVAGAEFFLTAGSRRYEIPFSGNMG